jgi:hypothetical protein
MDGIKFMQLRPSTYILPVYSHESYIGWLCTIITIIYKYFKSISNYHEAEGREFEEGDNRSGPQ